MCDERRSSHQRSSPRKYNNNRGGRDGNDLRRTSALRPSNSLVSGDRSSCNKKPKRRRDHLRSRSSSSAPIIEDVIPKRRRLNRDQPPFKPKCPGWLLEFGTGGLIGDQSSSSLQRRLPNPVHRGNDRREVPGESVCASTHSHPPQRDMKGFP